MIVQAGVTRHSHNMPLAGLVPPFGEFVFNVASHRQIPYGLLGTGSPGQPPRLAFTQFLSSDSGELSLSWCFTSTETIRLIRDGEPRTAISTFTQLLIAENGWPLASIQIAPPT